MHYYVYVCVCVCVCLVVFAYFAIFSIMHAVMRVVVVTLFICVECAGGYTYIDDCVYTMVVIM